MVMMIGDFVFQLSSHQHDCPKAQVSCQFHRYGCTFKVTAPHLFTFLSVSTMCTTQYYAGKVHHENSLFGFQGLNQDIRQHESTFAAEHLRMMATRNSLIENKVTVATRS